MTDSDFGKAGMDATRARVVAAALLTIAVAAGCGGTHRSAPAAPVLSGPDPLASAHHTAPPAPAGAVLTQRGDETRLGWYAHETRLTVASVAGGRFGRRAEFAVDGKVYAQPLYVPALTVGGTPPKLVIVATEHDSVYAFD